MVAAQYGHEDACALLAAGADPGRPAVPPDDTRGVWNVEVRV
jgi:hypothetical protein